ncbi:MAG: polysaccharide biosynthesis/export family protein [Bacteroidota bacterium]
MKNKLLAVKLICLSIIGLIVISCVPQSKMKYLQDKEGVAPVNVYPSIKEDYKLRCGDYVYIRILTLDEKSNEIFANITGSAASAYMNLTDQNLYLSSYLVNDSGYVTFPLLGNIHAAGHTVMEMEQNLNKAASEIIKESSVVVKLVLYNISVLGEVQSPGKYTIYNNRVNIFEALALARDLTTFANRGKVQIIRSDGTKNHVVTLDLLSKDILSSPYYYLQPNDIIYVEPLKYKTYGFESFPYVLVFSTITTALLIAQYFKK